MSSTPLQLTVSAEAAAPQISRHIFGQFSEHLGRCVYEGIWVGEDSPIPNVRGIRSDVVAALREIQVPNVRWPGGCFADAYHWRDGIGPRAQRPRTGSITFQNLIATIYHVLAIDVRSQLVDFNGRPQNLLNDVTPVGELVG